MDLDEPGCGWMIRSVFTGFNHFQPGNYGYVIVGEMQSLHACHSMTCCGLVDKQSTGYLFLCAFLFLGKWLNGSVVNYFQLDLPVLGKGLEVTLNLYVWKSYFQSTM